MREKERKRGEREERIKEQLSCRPDALDMTGSHRVRAFIVAGCLPCE